MVETETLEIWYEGHDGSIFHISGGDEGASEGICLGNAEAGTMWEDMYESPFEAIYESTAFEIGGRYGGLRENMFEFILAFRIKSTVDRPWRINDSRFRKALSPTKDSKLHVKIQGETHRWLNVRLLNQPKLKVEQDPNLRRYGLLLVTFVASYPRWLEDDFTDSYTTTTNTTSSGTEIGEVTVSNPTDTEIWLKWTLTAPIAGLVWTLPDFSWGDDRFSRAAVDADRMVSLPSLIANENVVVDTDEMTMGGQVNSDLDTSIYQRMNGRQFLYPVPPYTPPTDIPISVTGAPIGAGVQVRCPRTFSRPWGLE